MSSGVKPSLPHADGLGGRGGLSINLATLRGQADMAQAIEACLRNGISAISPWRDQIATIGLEKAARLVREHQLRVTGVCRGGMFTAADETGRRKAVEDNKAAIDEAEALNADCLVLVVGGLPEGSRDLAGARQQVAEGVAAVLSHADAAGVRLAIEPLHPMYAADRACVNTLGQALDMAEAIAPNIGVAIDSYHVWWDPDLDRQIARAGAQDRIFAHHICDWLVPTSDMLLDRGMMGDGVIDLSDFRNKIEAAGFHGAQEVEIFSAKNWWTQEIDHVLQTCIQRYQKI